MVQFKETVISAHHNYLVNGMLTPGFVIGDPDSDSGFYFLADVLLPGESTPRISARILDPQGGLMVELSWNRIKENRAQCTYKSFQGGFCLLQITGEALLEVQTDSYANGYLTRIRASLTDEQGTVRVEPFGESIRVHGYTHLVLDTPFSMSE